MLIVPLLLLGCADASNVDDKLAFEIVIGEEQSSLECRGKTSFTPEANITASLHESMSDIAQKLCDAQVNVLRNHSQTEIFLTEELPSLNSITIDFSCLNGSKPAVSNVSNLSELCDSVFKEFEQTQL
jgi:hypothetical protein